MMISYALEYNKKKAFYSHTNLHIGVCWFFWPLFNKGLHITKLIPGAFWEKNII